MELIEVGFGHVVPGMAGRLHHHENDHEFHYITQGRGRFIRNGLDHEASRGLLFYCPAGMAHDTLSGGNQRTSLYYMRFYLPPAALDLGKSLIKKIPGKGLMVGDSLRPFFSEILWKWRSGLPPLHESARCLCHSLLHELGSGMGPLFAGRHNPHVQKSLEFLQRNLRRNLTLPEIAGEVGMNPSYLVRLFRKHLGRPPLAYFARMRVEASGHWLRRTDEPITAISEAFGFCDPFHFSSVFRRHMGVSPRAYRAAFQNGAP